MNCERCGESFDNSRQAGKPRRFCSERCRSAEEKRRAKIRLREWQDKQRKEETGLEWHEEKCKTCGSIFPRYKDVEGRQGWRKYCSEECSDKARAYKKVEPSVRKCIQCGVDFVSIKGKICSDSCKRARREDKSFRGHPISREEFKALEELQEGCCKICGEEKPLVVDHCHKEGQVRGLLCSQCNSGLGMFYDNIAFLSAAIEYLKE